MKEIDISKISNLEINAADNQSVQDFISNNQKKENKKEELAKAIRYEYEKFEKFPRKFEFVQPERIQLPSRGVCYQDCDDKDVREGYIWLYPLTMKDEEILSTPKYIIDGSATIRVLNDCIKSNIDALDLLVSDFYFLLLYLRKLSISDKFEFNFTCPNCGESFNHDIRISELSDLYDFNPEDYKEPVRIDLPKSGYIVVLSMPRMRGIREVNWLLEIMGDKIGIANMIASRTIAIITNNGEEVSKDDWADFFNNLTHEDFNTLMKELDFSNGLNRFTKQVVCPKCGKSIEGSEVELNNDALFHFQES